MTPDDLVNQALDEIGLPRIASLYDGSLLSQVALDLWFTSKDECLAAHPWGFAFREVALVEAVDAAFGGWAHAYAWQVPFITLRYLRPDTTPTDPLPIRFSIGYSSALVNRLILTNQAGAQAAVTWRVEDPDDFEPSFTLLLIATLSKKLSTDARLKNEPRGRMQSSAGADRAAADRNAS